MKYVKSFNEKNSFFNSLDSSNPDRDILVGRLLHIYGAIPIPKKKADNVIKKILRGHFYNIGDDIDLNYKEPHDKVRFVDYFDSLINSKEIRGHNFEGFISGVYNGTLAKNPNAKYDVEINNQTWSVKFIDKSWKAPEISSYRKELENLDIIENNGGLTKIFQSDDDNLKNKLWKIISKDITGGWLIGYEIKTENENYILVNIIDLDTMYEILMNGGTVSPKGGLESYYSLAISAKYKNNPNIKSFKIIIPQLSIDELKSIYSNNSELNWSKKIFGKKYGYKIRPDVLRYIKKNSEEIANRLLKFKDFY